MNFGTHNDGGTNGGVSQLRNKLDGKTTYLLGGHASQRVVNRSAVGHMRTQMRTENFRISMVTGNGNAGDNTNNGASSGARISPMLGPS